METRVGRFLVRHPSAHFGLFVGFMGAIAAFGLWRLADVFGTQHHVPATLIAEAALAPVVVAMAWRPFFQARAPLPRWKIALGAALSAGAVVAVAPARNTLAQFPQPAWAQVPAAAFWLSFAVGCLVAGVRGRLRGVPVGRRPH